MIETVALVLTGLSITASIVYYAMVLRNTSKARQRDLIIQRYQAMSIEYMKIYREVSNYEFKNWEEWQEKYGRWDNPDADAKWLYIMLVFNMAGIILKENLGEADLIFQLYNESVVIQLWEQFRDIVKEVRKAVQNPLFLEPFENLYTEAKKRRPEISFLPRNVET